MEHRSPFREATLSCPRCCTSLSRGEPSFCARCEGAWISEQTLIERVATMQRAPAELEWATESRTAITCVVCQEPMTAVVVFGVPIDRGRPHGLWFDRDELAQVLYTSSQRPPTEARRRAGGDAGSNDSSLGGDVALDGIVGGIAEVAAEATGEVTVEVAGGLLEAIGELLGGL